MYRYKMSVIMAVYNVEPFIHEAIGSVIAQDIGFDKIQLILVDDGSQDGSGAICDEYGEKYPNNVVVIHKENGGASSARNAGVSWAEGEYINFMDPDDKLDLHTMSSVCRFFEKHGDETDVVSIPMKFFDAQTGEHTLNYKYKKGSRVIDLEEDWGNPQMSISTTFIKAECKDLIHFDSNLIQAEDAKVMQQVLLQKRTLGVLDDAVYWYRKRSVGEKSAMQSNAMRKAYYMQMVKHFQLAVIKDCLNTYNEIPRFIQFNLMYDLQWKIRQSEIPENVLTEAEKLEYYDLIRTVLQYIDNDVIDAQRNLNWAQKQFVYRLKYDNLLTRHEKLEDVSICVGDVVCFKASDSPLRLESYKNQGGNCILEGVLSIAHTLMESCEILIKVGDSFYKANIFGRMPALCLGQEIEYYLSFRVEIPLETRKVLEWEFYCKTGEIQIALHNLQYGRHFPISEKYTRNYYATENWILTRKKSKLLLTPRRIGLCFRHELLLCCELLSSRHKIARNSVISRVLLHVLKPFKRKQIWLISDLEPKAGGNGEAFFHYIRENHPEIDARFVTNANCQDFGTMKKNGYVVKKGSNLHKILHLLSDYIISSYDEDEIWNPFYRSYEPYRNLLANNRFIFLQHNLGEDDMKKACQMKDQHSKRIDIFSAFGDRNNNQRAYEKIVQLDYHS